MDIFMMKLRNRLKRCIDASDISIEQMKNLTNQGAILIDVRSPQEYAEGHLPGAICIPEYSIQKDISQKIQNFEQMIILYCDSGVRSKTAQHKLQRMGYKQVYNLCK